MTAVRNKQFRYRERPSGRRKTKFVIGVLALALAIAGGYLLQRDVRTDRVLSQRGVAATGTLADKGCWACRAVLVSFTTSAGQKVSTVVTALGPQKDTTIGAAGTTRGTPPRCTPPRVCARRRASQPERLSSACSCCLPASACSGGADVAHGPRVRTRSLASQDATGHVRLV